MTAETIYQWLPPLIFLTFFIVLFCIWYNFAKYKSAGWFALAYLLGAFAFALELVLPVSRDPILLTLHVFHDVLYLLITGLSVIGYSVRYNKPVPKLPYVFCLLVSVLSLFWFWFVQDIVLARFITITSCSAFMLYLSTSIVMRARKTRYDSILVAVLCSAAIILALQSAFSGQIFANPQELNSETYSTSVVATLVSVASALISLAVAIAIIAGFAMEIIAEYRQKSEIDFLTNTLNRRGFEELAIQELSKIELTDSRYH